MRHSIRPGISHSETAYKALANMFMALGTSRCEIYPLETVFETKLQALNKALARLRAGAGVRQRALQARANHGVRLRRRHARNRAE